MEHTMSIYSIKHREYLINKRKQLVQELTVLENTLLKETNVDNIELLKKAIHLVRSKLSDIKFRIGSYNVTNNTKQQTALQKAYREKVKELIGVEEYYKFNMKLTEEIQKQYPAITKKELQ